MRAAQCSGVRVLTAYAFSEENWSRPTFEVRGLMEMFAHYARRERRALIAERARIRVMGRTDELPPGPRGALDELVAATARCTGLILNLAINYSARRELSDAVRALAREAAAGRLDPEAIDEEMISASLYTEGLPDPDLLIRTGGELRLSNFLLYQSAYTEIWSTPRHWPSFDAELLGEALAAYAQRQRRFGR